MKIGIVCYPSIGGSGVVATELGRSLSRRGHTIHFFSYDVPQKLENATEEFHFHHVDVPLYPLFRFPPYTLALAASIYEMSQSDPLDLLHVHYAVPHSTSAFIAKHMLCSRKNQKLKVITTLHGTDTELVGQMPSYKSVVEYSIDVSNAVTAVSEYLRRSTLQQFNIQNDIQVIYNPINTRVFSPAPESERQLHSKKVIVHISNFRPVKRVYDVIKVFDLIAAVMPAKLLFLGEGPDRNNAEQLVSRLGLNDKVSFLGPRSDVVDVLKSADLLLSTSENESFGLTVAEAMSCEVPVVGTSVGGVPEVVEHGVTGMLAPVGNVQRLAEAAIQILSDFSLQMKMGKAGRKRVLEQFNMDLITDQYEALYNRVLQSTEECPEERKHLANITKG